MPLRWISKMIKQELKEFLKQLFPEETIIIDYVPKQKQGDYSTNLAFKIAARQKKNPYTVAREIAVRIKAPLIKNVTVHKPGFINFEIEEKYLLKKLFGEEPKKAVRQKEKILVEYVSVNPTGPINIVNARAAAVGDSLVKVLNATGYEATAEYYINDGGRQTELLAESVRQRIIELNGGTPKIPENGYHGEYLINVAKEIKEKGIEDIKAIKKYSVDFFINEQKRTLENFGVVFDVWTRESEIYKKGYVEKVLTTLQNKEFTYKKDGALFFKASLFGDKDDRVIVTSDGRYTYLLPDIAYHVDKIERGYNRLIDIWGPDHHGHIPGLVGGIKAVGYSKKIIEVLIVQEVKLKRDGKVVTMSKRAGTFTTLDELLEEVPKDVVRFFMLMRSNSQHLEFDIDLALKQSDENPVYYVQYAHARIKSILRKAKEKNFEPNDRFAYDNIKEDEEIALVKTILKFPEVLEDAARTREPYMITYYLIELARTFHYFYQKLRVLSDDSELTQARLALINKVAETIKQGLDILGVSCPERM